MANPTNNPLNVSFAAFEPTNPNIHVAKNPTDSAYVKKNPDVYEVRSGACPVGSLPFTNLLNQVTLIKLDRNNFLLWQNIALPILRSHKLEGHLTGKDECPKHSIIIPPSEDERKGLTLPNPEHDIWLAADQLLVGWLYNSMTAEVVSKVTG